MGRHWIWYWTEDRYAVSRILTIQTSYTRGAFRFSAWITLGYPVSETPNEPKFVGSLSRVNVWTRALSFEEEIPKLAESCQGAPEVFDGLILRWNGYDMLSGKLEKVVPSNCVGGGNGGGPICPPTVDPSVQCRIDDFVDKTPPMAKGCPGDIFVESAKREVNVTWTEPVFSDDILLTKVEHNLKPGQVFTWGNYLVSIFGTRSIDAISHHFLSGGLRRLRQQQ